jgi:flavin reductase (DIM6/NTAB) family NADH-FMN oxidoreductase RutF
MHCAYKPPMMAIAIQNTCASYDLIKQTEEYVLSVPGPSLAYETLFCGVKSMREVDKIGALNLELCASQEISVPGLAKAIANIELLKETLLDMGDHVLVVGRVVRFGVNTKSRELPLLSLGPDTRGYKVLVRKGIHRIGVVARGDAGRA